MGHNNKQRYKILLLYFIPACKQDLIGKTAAAKELIVSTFQWCLSVFRLGSVCSKSSVSHCRHGENAEGTRESCQVTFATSFVCVCRPERRVLNSTELYSAGLASTRLLVECPVSSTSYWLRPGFPTTWFWRWMRSTKISPVNSHVVEPICCIHGGRQGCQVGKMCCNTGSVGQIQTRPC